MKNDADRSTFLAAALRKHAEFAANKKHYWMGRIAEESPGKL